MYILYDIMSYYIYRVGRLLVDAAHVGETRREGR